MVHDQMLPKQVNKNVLCGDKNFAVRPFVSLYLPAIWEHTGLAWSVSSPRHVQKSLQAIRYPLQNHICNATRDGLELPLPSGSLALSGEFVMQPSATLHRDCRIFNGHQRNVWQARHVFGICWYIHARSTARSILFSQSRRTRTQRSTAFQCWQPT